jgi:transcriptional regulator with XRE-family HTH domain
MSPNTFSRPPADAVTAALRNFWSTLGRRMREERIDRRWTTQQLADRAGVSRWLVYLAERGEPISMEAALRLIGALGLRLEVELTDPRRRERPIRQADIVHSAMGEFEARHLRPHGFGVGVDEPYQHYQFAGRADLVAWSLEQRSLLHIENRTQLPDLQDMAGRFNAKRAYLGQVLAERLGIRRWQSETHVIAALWSSEVLHVLRMRSETIRAVCPDSGIAFAGWWEGAPPAAGRHSELVVIDPLATSRQRPFVGLERALTARPRFRDYREAAQRLAGL